MKIVGLTGGIGSGKTTVAQLFQKFGVPIYMADFEAKQLMNTSEVIRRKLTKLFGKNAYVNGMINKAFLADQIFRNKELLLKMNAIVHPEVAIHFNKWVLVQNAPYIIKEVAILFENGSYKECDFVVTVTALEKHRIQRVLERDHTTAERIKAIMNNQWDDDEKINKSHFVIVNNDLNHTEAQVVKVHEEILKRIEKV